MSESSEKNELELIIKLQNFKEYGKTTKVIIEVGVITVLGILIYLLKTYHSEYDLNSYVVIGLSMLMGGGIMIIYNFRQGYILLSPLIQYINFDKAIERLKKLNDINSTK